MWKPEAIYIAAASTILWLRYCWREQGDASGPRCSARAGAGPASCRQLPAAGGRMRVAVAGCCHGELDRIYETLALAERRGPGPIDLLLCCGDFQAVRNEADLRCMAVPPKYRHMQTFYRPRIKDRQPKQPNS
ncbi:lariat debranching enzyme-like isoform X2 [Manis javanica]|uniref:lariat debranching enzyme-like isoform X2 n=1 Tax=Manis javanica TaxID=9974 RepID=UPI003C6D2D72